MYKLKYTGDTLIVSLIDSIEKDIDSIAQDYWLVTRYFLSQFWNLCGVRRALPVSQVRTNENGLSVTCVCVRVCVYVAYGDGGVSDRGCADGCSMEGAVAYHLAKTGSFQSSSRHLDSNRTRFVYVGEGDRRETVVSCVRPCLHSYRLFSSSLPCHYLSFLYLPTLAVSFSERWHHTSGCMTIEHSA